MRGIATFSGEVVETDHLEEVSGLVWRQLLFPAYCLTRKCYSRVVVACFQQRYSRCDVLDLFLSLMSLLFGVASRTRPLAIDARGRCEAHGRFAVMVDAMADEQIACRPF